MNVPSPSVLPEDPLGFDPAAFDRLMEGYRWLRLWFDPVVIDAENLRPRGRTIIASNHGQFGLEGGLLAEEILRRTGRRGRPLSDRVFFRTPLVGDAFRNCGIVEGNRANAVHLLEDEQLVMTMPGGAREALASEAERYRLFWPAAAGFARVSIQTGAPVVPVASIGSDDFYRLPVSAEATGRSPFGWLVRTLVGEERYVPPLYAGLGLLPLPQQLLFVVGEPIFPGVDPSLAEDESAVAALTSRARASLEALIARGLTLRDERERSDDQSLRGWLNKVLRVVRAPIDVPGYRD